jgi:WD40 repeat protein
MDLRTKEYFKRFEVFPTPNKILSINTNTQNTIFCVVDLQLSVSVYTKDFKFLFKLDDYKEPGNKVFTAFSPNGEYLIVSSKEITKITIIEIETQNKKVISHFFRYAHVYFLSFEDFIIIKAFNHLSATNKMMKSGEIKNEDENTFTPLFDFQNRMMYMFTSNSNIHCYDLDSMELIITKENSEIEYFSNKCFLMKNGNLFMFSMFDQYMLDKKLIVLRNYKLSDFNYLKLIDVVETENFLISILENNCLAIQDPETLNKLILYKRKHEFSSLVYLGANSKEPCILTGSPTSRNIFAWFLNGNSKIIQILKRKKVLDVHFHFEEFNELDTQRETLVKIQKKLEESDAQPHRILMKKPTSNALIYVALSVLISLISFIFYFRLKKT